MKENTDYEKEFEDWLKNSGITEKQIVIAREEIKLYYLIWRSIYLDEDIGGIVSFSSDRINSVYRRVSERIECEKQ